MDVGGKYTMLEAGLLGVASERDTHRKGVDTATDTGRCKT